ncbi:MAG TPA: hypothetical protein VJR47_08220 [Stellaceae bacterium]|nr:hypothetical protein [Stellaceae bacterium]
MTPITLAGRSFTLRPLTLGQLRVILPAFARAAGLAREEAVDAAIDILAAALSRDAPEITRATLLGWEMLPAELIAAVDAIARLSGLVQQEAQPGEAPASAGASSTAS